MQVTIGKAGLNETFQESFPETTECVYCKSIARIGFVAHEGNHNEKTKEFVCNLHDNDGGKGGDYWLHNCCCVAIYFCTKCLEPTARYNQA